MSEPAPEQTTAPPGEAADVVAEALSVLDLVGGYLAENWAFVVLPAYMLAIIFVVQGLKGLIRAVVPEAVAPLVIGSLPVLLGAVSAFYLLPSIMSDVPWLFVDGPISVMWGIVLGGLAQWVYVKHKDGKLGDALKWCARVTLAILQSIPVVKVPAAIVEAIEGMTASGRAPVDKDAMEFLRTLGRVVVKDDHFEVWPHDTEP